jgi:uncharacterized membrane protein YeaQ/YmgE (transglycosylase-associated protein family)
MSSVVLSIIVGAIVGWLGSFATRSGTQGGILLYIAMGAIGVAVGPLIVLAGSLFDSALAAALGAMIFAAVVAMAERHQDGRTSGP